MSEITTISIALTITLLLVLRCKTDNVSADSVIATDSNYNGRVEITSGKNLILKLKAQPGTGYSWIIVKNDPNLL